MRHPNVYPPFGTDGEGLLEQKKYEMAAAALNLAIIAIYGSLFEKLADDMGVTHEHQTILGSQEIQRIQTPGHDRIRGVVAAHRIDRYPHYSSLVSASLRPGRT